jgi:cation:H+ antiporter
MLVAILMLVAGAAVLTVGAEAAIRGAGRFALAHVISPFLLGALLFGVDLESLGAAVIAAGKGQTSLAAGEAFGTIVFLFSVGFGAALLVSREPVPSPSEGMVIVPAVAMLAGSVTMVDQVVNRIEGAALVVVYVAYISLVVRESRGAKARAEEIQREAAEGPRLPPSVFLVGGLLLVLVGASVLVDGGVRVLDRTGLAAGFVGAAIIGGLAALDEVLLEVLPVLRGMPELATGNLFGTAAAFSTGVLGLTALVRPLDIDTAAMTAYLTAAVLYTIVSVAFLVRGRAGKGVGLSLLLVYGLWLAFASQM